MPKEEEEKTWIASIKKVESLKGQEEIINEDPNKLFLGEYVGLRRVKR